MISRYQSAALYVNFDGDLAWGDPLCRVCEGRGWLGIEDDTEDLEELVGFENCSCSHPHDDEDVDRMAERAFFLMMLREQAQEIRAQAEPEELPRRLV